MEYVPSTFFHWTNRYQLRCMYKGIESDWNIQDRTEHQFVRYVRIRVTIAQNALRFRTRREEEKKVSQIIMGYQWKQIMKWSNNTREEWNMPIAKWSSGFICGHDICFSEEEFLNISAHGGGALFCLWEHRTPQPWADIYRSYQFILLFNFQISARVYLLHLNLGCSGCIPLALMFTSGLSYIMPQNLLKNNNNIHNL